MLQASFSYNWHVTSIAQCALTHFHVPSFTSQTDVISAMYLVYVNFALLDKSDLPLNLSVHHMKSSGEYKVPYMPSKTEMYLL